MAESHDHGHHSGHHHSHGHHDHQQPVDSSAFTDANREHWNKYAGSYYSEQWQKDLVNQINAFLLTNISWIGVDFVDPASTFGKPTEPAKQVRVLDYACGPGTMTNALTGRATEYVGVDLSENMVAAYNVRFNPEPDPSESGKPENNPEERLNAHAVVGNLLSTNGTPTHLDDPKFWNFDLVMVGMGFHHFSNLPLVMERLVERLKPGGVFIIVDFHSHTPAEEEKNHPAAHTISHHGFSVEGLKLLFEGAGLTDFGVRTMEEKAKIKDFDPRELLLAKGRKAVQSEGVSSNVPSL